MIFLNPQLENVSPAENVCFRNFPAIFSMSRGFVPGGGCVCVPFKNSAKTHHEKNHENYEAAAEN